MNITAQVINYIPNHEISSIIENNTEIQFYNYDGKLYWRDSRFRKSMSEFSNPIATNMESLYEIFVNHINSLTKKWLEITKDNLIKKYLTESNKPESYFQELNYLNKELISRNFKL